MLREYGEGVKLRGIVGFECNDVVSLEGQRLECSSNGKLDVQQQ